MNPFELQTQFAQQWFQLAQNFTTSAMAACASMNPWLSTARAAAPAPSNPFFPFTWLQAPAAPAPLPAFTAFGTMPWTANPFTAWMGLFQAQPTAPAMFPGWPLAPSPLTPAPFAEAIARFMTPWAFAPMALREWTAVFTPAARNPGAELMEQIASNYRTASGYAVAAVVGPLGTALDPRTYGEPWWQQLDKHKKLN